MAARLIMSVLCLGPLLTLFGCGPGTDRGLLSLPISGRLQPDPARARVNDEWASQLVYAGLVQLDGDLNVLPSLAVGLPYISPNGRVYTFTLRTDARFANGDRLTLHDVIFSLRRALAVANRSRSAWRGFCVIEGACSRRTGRERLGIRETQATNQIRISLIRPSPQFLVTLALPPGAIVDAKQVRRGGRWWSRGAGAGPFRLIRLGRVSALRPNAHYFGGKSQLRGISLIRSDHQDNSYQLFSRGRLDATPVPIPLYASTASSPHFVSTDATDAFFVYLSPGIPRRVRIGIDEHLNRSDLASNDHPFDPASSLVPPIVPDYPALTDARPLAGSIGVAFGRRPMLTWPKSTPPYLRHWLLTSLTSNIGRHLGATRRVAGKVTLLDARMTLPTPDSWLATLGDVVFGQLPSSFSRDIRRAESASSVEEEWHFDNLAETILFKSARLLPIAVRKQGYLIGSRVQGLTATPLGLEPSGENWATVSLD